MREHRILYSDEAWELIRREAKEMGISAGQLVREASTAYAVWHLAKRGGNETSQQIEDLIRKLRG